MTPVLFIIYNYFWLSLSTLASNRIVKLVGVSYVPDG